MKLFIRLCFSLILSVAIPVTGMAQMLMTTGNPTIPAESVDPVAHQAMDDEHDCCAPEHLHKYQGVCENGQECQTSSMLESLTEKPAAYFPHSHCPSPSIGLAPSLALEPIWHPPRV
ncbi:hypothetical protein [Pseudomonas sp. SST3]|uniref:hypothetical protein n=1 Tax=Pseudomonas sp. SST3 TaxID=2267882 RepID=UPI000E04D85E|nr:hypothetical protein [Pseudomonas sp. SST3]NKQ10505.1 hypothetical protein [Pseudomonas sp. SST3]